MAGKEYKIRSMFFNDEDRQKSISRSADEKFTIKALFPKDHKEIARRRAIDQNGLPNSSFSSDDLFIIDRTHTIDVAIIESPQWWKAADDCPDFELLNWLYSEITEWQNEFQKSLKKNQLSRRSTETPLPS